MSLIWNGVQSSRQARRLKKKLNSKFAPFGGCVKTVLGLEILLEDIPQFVLGALVTNDRGAMSPYIVFTLTTSSFNFILNLLDMIEIEDDADDVAAEESEALQGGDSERGGSARVY